jgi:PEP-CTERM motif
MRKLLGLLTAGALFSGAATVASAGVFPGTVTLSLAIGSLPTAGFYGATAGASSAGAGGAATLPANSISGIFGTAVSPPLLTLLDGIGVAAPGLVGSFAGALPASNNALSFNGTTGTMSLNASAYLLMTNNVTAEVPLGVVGVGGTQMFHVLTLVAGVIDANPYQLGMLTLMGALNTTPHTIMGTGVDGRTAGGQGTLVLVSPTLVNLGVLGSLASIATLTLTEVPEPTTLPLLGAGVVALAAIGRRQTARGRQGRCRPCEEASAGS